MKRRNVEQLKAALLNSLDEELARTEEECLESIIEQEEAFESAKEAIQLENDANSFLMQVQQKISHINEKKATLNNNIYITEYFKTLASYAKQQEHIKLSKAEYLVCENKRTVIIPEAPPNQFLSYRSVSCIVTLSVFSIGVLAAANLASRGVDAEQLEKNDYSSLFTCGYNSFRDGVSNIMKSVFAQQSSSQSLPKSTL